MVGHPLVRFCLPLALPPLAGALAVDDLPQRTCVGLELGKLAVALCARHETARVLRDWADGQHQLLCLLQLHVAETANGAMKRFQRRLLLDHRSPERGPHTSKN